MQFAGSEPTGQITISSSNPFDPSDTPKYVEGNAAGGIVFLGPNTWAPATQTAQGVTLDDVLVRNNAFYEVALDGVSNYGTYIGFINNSCLSGTNPTHVTPTSWTTLSNPLPGSYALYRGGVCPNPSGPPTPARSHIPGWTW